MEPGDTFGQNRTKQNHIHVADGEGLGLGVLRSDVTLIAPCYVSTKNCGNCLTNENREPEGHSAKYIASENKDIRGITI